MSLVLTQGSLVRCFLCHLLRVLLHFWNELTRDIYDFFICDGCGDYLLFNEDKEPPLKEDISLRFLFFATRATQSKNWLPSRQVTRPEDQIREIWKRTTPVFNLSGS